jgi:hypothetical protein
MASKDPYQIRPSAYWYGVVGVAWVASIVCMVFAMKPFFDVVDVTPTRAVNRAAVDVPEGGLTVYASSSISGAPLCSLVDRAGHIVPLDDVTDSSSFHVTASDGTRMYPIATTPSDLPAGQYTLRCVGIGSLRLALGDRIDFEHVLLQVGGLFILAGFLGVAGLVVLIVVLVRRHNSKARVRWAQAAYAGWGQWYAQPYAPHGQYPGQPQQGYGQPGWPPAQQWQPPGATDEPPSDRPSDDR